MNAGKQIRCLSPELREDALLQAQILVPVLLHHSSLPLDRVFQSPHGLRQLPADLLLGALQLDAQRLLVLELKGGESGRESGVRSRSEQKGSDAEEAGLA